MPSYSPLIPTANQLISSTQTPILQNFTSINALVNVNHVGFNTPDTYGMHNFTSFVSQPSDPSTAGLDEMVMYCKAAASIAGYELFVRYPNNGAVLQITGTQNPEPTNPGYAYMSSTVMMKWGMATGIVANTSNVIVFPTGGGIPAFNATPLSILFTPSIGYTVTASGSVYTSSPSATQFTLQALTPTFATSVYWMAIGTY